MKFDVEQVVNGYTVKVDESGEIHVARTAEEVAEIVTKALSGGKPAKTKKARKPRGPNKKKVAAANSDALAGLT
jgi:hypothetical protein